MAVIILVVDAILHIVYSSLLYKTVFDDLSNTMACLAFITGGFELFEETSIT